MWETELLDLLLYVGYRHFSTKVYGETFKIQS